MGIGVRVFFVENEGRLKRISLKRFQSLIDSGQDVERLPEYAGQRLRITIVILAVKGRKPVAIERIDRAILVFDGSLRETSGQHNEKQEIDEYCRTRHSLIMLSKVVTVYRGA